MKTIEGLEKELKETEDALLTVYGQNAKLVRVIQKVSAHCCGCSARTTEATEGFTEGDGL